MENHNHKDERFKAGLPETLYLNHYELADRFPGYTATEWRIYQQENRAFIDLELAAITEAKARSALKALGTSSIKSSEVAALKQLLDRSQVINDKVNQKPQTIVTYMPNPAKIRAEQAKIAEKESINP